MRAMVGTGGDDGEVREASYTVYRKQTQHDCTNRGLHSLRCIRSW